ncbi:MAG: hypothetical protein AB7F43_05635 [Bacteriovoracia bacterium]
MRVLKLKFLLLFIAIFARNPLWAAHSNGDHSNCAHAQYSSETGVVAQGELNRKLIDCRLRAVESGDYRQFILDKKASAKAYSFLEEGLKGKDDRSTLQMLGAWFSVHLPGYELYRVTREEGVRSALSFWFEKGMLAGLGAAVGEMTEWYLFALAAMYPKFGVVLAPIAASHVTDYIGFYLGLSAGDTIKKLKVRSRNDSILDFGERYRGELAKQRAVMPIDFDNVLLVTSLPTCGQTCEPNKKIGEIQFAVTKDTFFERHAPNSVHDTFYPEKVVLREVMPSVSVNELEEIVKRVTRPNLNVLDSSDRAIYGYAALMIEEISRSKEALAELSKLVDSRKEQVKENLLEQARAAIHRLGEIDLNDLTPVLKEEGFLDNLHTLRARIYKLGPTPQIVAQRLLWYLRAAYEKLKLHVLRQPKPTLEKYRVALSTIREAIQQREMFSDPDLVQIATNPNLSFKYDRYVANRIAEAVWPAKLAVDFLVKELPDLELDETFDIVAIQTQLQSDNVEHARFAAQTTLYQLKLRAEALRKLNTEKALKLADNLLIFSESGWFSNEPLVDVALGTSTLNGQSPELIASIKSLLDEYSKQVESEHHGEGNDHYAHDHGHEHHHDHNHEQHDEHHHGEQSCGDLTKPSCPNCHH